MGPALLLLIGLSSSVNLGERAPGLVALAEWRTSATVVRAMADTTDKYTGAGWRTAGSLDGRLWRGLEAGAEVVYRDGGPWTKATAWARVGWRVKNLTVTGRLRVAGDPPASGAVEAVYTATRGRLAVQLQQGVLLYRQPTLQAGYYTTVTAGMRLGKALR
jgi:hypothetical protein